MDEPVSPDAGANNHTQRRAAVAVIAYAMLCVIGMVISLELTDVYHRTKTDPDFQSTCAINEGMNCQTVADSTPS